MKQKYKINEIAKIFNISRQTLIYYDKINLFKPKSIDTNNLYRYYIEEQFFQLEFIILLKEAGFTLNEIKEYIQTETLEDSLIYLKEKSEQINYKIKLLNKTQEAINRKINEIKSINNGIEEPDIVILEETRVYMLPLTTPLNYIDYNNKFKKLEEIKKQYNIVGDEFIEFLNLDLNEEKYYEFENLTKLGFIIPTNNKRIYLEEKISGGLYAYLMHKGSWNNIKNTYEVLIKFIKKNNYKIVGSPIEIFNDIIVHLGRSGGGTRVKIYIPIEKIN